MLWLIWHVGLLFVTIIMFIKQSVYVNQMVGDKVKRCHILVLCGFAVVIH